MSEFYKREFAIQSIQQVNPVGMQEAVRTTEQSAQILANSGENLYKAGRDMYLMDIESQAREQLRNAFDANQSNPDGFSKQADAIRKGLSKTKALPSVRQAGDKLYNELFDSYNQKVKNNYQQRVTEDYKLSVYKTFDQRQKDIASQMRASINSDGTTNELAQAEMIKQFATADSSLGAVGPDGQHLFSPEQRMSMRKGMIETAANTSAFTMISQSDNPEEMAQKFASGELGFEISLDGKTEKVSLVDYVDKTTAKLIMNEGLRRQKLMQAEQKKNADLMDAQIDYSVTQADTIDDFAMLDEGVNQAKAAGSIGEIQFLKAKTKIVKASEDKLKEIELVEKGSGFSDGTKILNPQIPEDVQALDLHYSNVIEPQTRNMQYPEANNMKASMVGNAGVLPKTLLGDLQSAAISQDLKRMEQSSDLLNRLKMQNNMVYDSVPEKTKAYLGMYSELRQAGYAPEIIKEKLDAIRQPQNPSMIQAREDMANKVLVDKDANDILDEVYDSGVAGWVTTQPEITDPQAYAMKSAYDAIYKSHFAITGDENVSRKEAATMVAKQFSPTTINGRKEVMRYAPEGYYQMEPEAMRDDLLNFAIGKAQKGIFNLPSDFNESQRKDVTGKYEGKVFKKAIDAGASPIEAKKMQYLSSRIILVPNPLFTPQTASSGSPLYDVQVIGEDGIPRTILDDGNGWQPDVEAYKKKQLEKFNARD